MTARPGRIKEVIPVHLPRPRHLEMINSKEFGELFDHTFRLDGEVMDLSRRVSHVSQSVALLPL